MNRSVLLLMRHVALPGQSITFTRSKSTPSQTQESNLIAHQEALLLPFSLRLSLSTTHTFSLSLSLSTTHTASAKLTLGLPPPLP